MIICTYDDKDTCNVEKMGCKGCNYFVDTETQLLMSKIIDNGINTYKILKKSMGKIYTDRSVTTRAKKELIEKETDLYINAYEKLKLILKKEIENGDT